MSLRAKSAGRSDAEAAGIVPFHGCHPGHAVVGSEPAGPWPQDTDVSGAVASGEGAGVLAEAVAVATRRVAAERAGGKTSGTEPRVECAVRAGGGAAKRDPK